jgi:hypothetical protein
MQLGILKEIDDKLVGILELRRLQRLGILQGIDGILHVRKDREQDE